jgi:hypothetical protein
MYLAHVNEAVVEETKNLKIESDFHIIASFYNILEFNTTLNYSNFECTKPHHTG